ncbi:MAG: type 4a pilus biogenesis protein PilO [Candidatus Paceibacterota bacterium]
MDFKKRLLITIGIPLGICALLIGATIFIGFDIGDRATNANEKRLTFISRLAIADSLASLKKDSEQIKSYYTVIENILPKRDRLVLFPRDINTIGAQNNLDINITLGQGAVGGEGGYWDTKFKINGKGTIENFINFIKKLENGQYLIGLESIDFTREGDNFKALLSGDVFSM